METIGDFDKKNFSGEVGAEDRLEEDGAVSRRQGHKDPTMKTVLLRILNVNKK